MNTSSGAHKLACLARWLLAKPLANRRATLDRMEKRHGAQFIETLKSAITEEWEKKRG